MNLYTEHAREILQMPVGWSGYQFESIGDGRLIRVVGAVAPLKTRGKYKGFPNWRNLDKATEKTAFFTPAEHEEWLSQWEQKTGNCSECGGTGQLFARWSAANGTEHKPCGKCGATGQMHNV